MKIYNSLIKLENVYHRYSITRDIFNDISIDINEGGFYFITGSSGSGKTTLLKLISSSLKPSKGNILFLGQKMNDIQKKDLYKIKRQIGFVFQDFRLLPHLTTYENVALPLRIQNKNEKDYKKDVVELLSWVNLEHCIHSYPNYLSGGEQQRAAIARAVISSPKIILADEPTGNVDQTNSSKILTLFQEMNKLGTTIIIATHDEKLLSEINAPIIEIIDQKININNRK
ncbi:MAG: cell division ATP-binding protein FtsE [Hyphomicrobiales bacterium]|nr:cell division ATP-binding protein FtsE [Hyphomicrobiales bacterium]|tara:strand:+ start:376 stop:1059 length:684 start_codon:yes stop_codon:yes gene_type:complete